MQSSEVTEPSVCTEYLVLFPCSHVLRGEAFSLTVVNDGLKINVRIRVELDQLKFFTAL